MSWGAVSFRRNKGFCLSCKCGIPEKSQATSTVHPWRTSTKISPHFLMLSRTCLWFVSSKRHASGIAQLLLTIMFIDDYWQFILCQSLSVTAEFSRMQVTSHLWQWSGSNALWSIWFLIIPCFLRGQTTRCIELALLKYSSSSSLLKALMLAARGFLELGRSAENSQGMKGSMSLLRTNLLSVSSHGAWHIWKDCWSSRKVRRGGEDFRTKCGVSRSN